MTFERFFRILVHALVLPRARFRQLAIRVAIAEEALVAVLAQAGFGAVVFSALYHACRSVFFAKLSRQKFSLRVCVCDNLKLK